MSVIDKALAAITPQPSEAHRREATEKARAAYSEQTTAKMQMAELENIAPSSQAWLNKWGHIEGAVLTHMFEEENGWFLHLKEHGEHQDRLTARYTEEYQRYVA